MHIVNGAGHFPHQEQPSYCNKIIHKFIEGEDLISYRLFKPLRKLFFTEFDDKYQGVQTLIQSYNQLDQESNNNDSGGLSLYKSMGKLMNMTSSTDTLDPTVTTTTMTTLTSSDGNCSSSTRIEELDNNGVAVPEQQTSIIWRPVSALKVYGTNVLSSYKEPFDSAIESSSSVFTNGATVIANNVMKIYHSEEYF